MKKYLTLVVSGLMLVGCASSNYSLKRSFDDAAPLEDAAPVENDAEFELVEVGDTGNPIVKDVLVNDGSAEGFA